MIEAEIKLPLENRENIEEKLLNMGFVPGCRERETDTYFDNAAGEIRGQGQALRVRECVDLTTGKTRAQVNFKGQKLDQISMTRKELESEIESPETVRQLFLSIGFHIAEPVVTKLRTAYHRGPLTACLDQVEHLGDFLELEILLDGDAEYEAAMEQIAKVLSSLGYSMKDTARTSYLTMLQTKQDCPSASRTPEPDD